MDPVTIYGVITGTVGLLNTIRGLADDIRERYKHSKNVPKECIELDEELAKVESILIELQRYDARTMTPIMRGQLKEMRNHLKSGRRYLEEERRVSATTLSQAKKVVASQECIRSA